MRHHVLMMQSNEKKSDTDYEMIQEYIGICNRSISENCEKFPYKQIFGAVREQKNDVCIQMAVDGLDGRYVIRFLYGALICERLCNCGHCNFDGVWTTHYQYIAYVIENPDIYVKFPALLDWSWLYSDRQA